MKQIQTLIESAITTVVNSDKVDPAAIERTVELLRGLHLLFIQGSALEPGHPHRLDEADMEMIDHDFTVFRSMMSVRSSRVREATLSMLCAFSVVDQLEAVSNDNQLPLPLDSGLPDNVVDLCNRANGGTVPSPGGPPGRARAMDNDPDPRNNRAFDDGPNYEQEPGHPDNPVFP
jgi:hypothetical protein